MTKAELWHNIKKPSENLDKGSDGLSFTHSG